MMKWWGWGAADKSFPMADKPTLWPWIRTKLGLDANVQIKKPVDFSAIAMKPPKLSAELRADLENILGRDRVLTDAHERMLHTYGKSFPDLFRARHGRIQRAPDAVLLPTSHDEVEALVKLAHQKNVCLIPFGGGTNIVGGINPSTDDDRPSLTLSLRLMNQVLEVDSVSRTAKIQAGALGPDLEAQLAEGGHSLGHYPDSFEYSTLGGWLATRSAGMQSDAYGKIEDMVVSMKMVTPSGTIVTKTVPSSSAGPDLNRLMVGSEGTLGIITEATMRIHKNPAVKDYRGYLFKSFEDGVAAIQECVERGLSPSMIRLQDSGETELAFNMKSPKRGIEARIQKVVKSWLKFRGYTSPCIMIVGFEGLETTIASTRKATLKIMKDHGGFSLGASVGKTWSKDKFNVPYLRDYLMDYGCLADVAETATVWSNVLPLYNGMIAAMNEHFKQNGGHGYIGCHISHTYKTGACLYFTFAARQPETNQIEHYYTYKRLITDIIVDQGGTVSHHHAIGIEHQPWMKQEVSPAGLQALRAMKESLDPKRILNPGKLLPAEDAVTDFRQIEINA